MFSDVYGHSEKMISFKKDTTIKDLFVTWLQPLNFKNDRMFYFYQNKIIESDFNLKVLNEFQPSIDLNIDLHGVEDVDENYLYAANVEVNDKLINNDSAKIIDFHFYKFDKKTHERVDLFRASDIVDDKMLNPLLFEAPDNSPLYKFWDIYHWNWLQVYDNKMLLNYAFSGFQQIDLDTKKEDWHWSYNDNTFDKIEGVGDLSSPFYTHHLNKIESGPHKGRFSYFENGSDSVDNKPNLPARARIFEIDEKHNSINIIWEKIFDFTSDALGSVNVFDDYILVNVGMAFPKLEIQNIIETLGIDKALDYFVKLNRPMLYLFDNKGNPISEYIYEPGFYSYIASPIKRNPKRKDKLFGISHKNKTA